MNEMEKYHAQSVQKYAHMAGFGSMEENSNSSMIMSIVRYWYLVLITFILINAIAIPAIWFKVTSTYTTRGAIEVAPILTNILTGEDDRGGISNYQAFMNTQAQIMTSNRILQRVADDLKDKSVTLFDQSDLVGSLKNSLLYESLTIAPIKRSQWIEIAMESKVPNEGELVVNAFIRAYMAVAGSSAIEGGNQKLALLENERKVLSNKLQSQRRLIQELAKEYGTDSLEGRQNMMLQKVMAIQSELINLEVRHMNLETQKQLLLLHRHQAIAATDILRMRNEFINDDPFIQELTVAIVASQQDYLEQKQFLAPKNPTIIEKKQVIAELEAKLQQRREELETKFGEIITHEIERSEKYKLDEVVAELERTKHLKQTYESMLEKEDGKTIKLGQLQLRINEQQEQMAVTNELYDRIRERIHNVEMELKRPARISVADYASTGPAEDKKIKFIAVAIIGSLGLGMLFAIMKDRTNHSIKTPDDITKHVGIKVIGTISSIKRAKDTSTIEKIRDEYQTVCTNIGLLNCSGMPPKLVVTSPGPAEGKTTLAINIATSIAKTGKKVLLIDGDLRKPDVARLLNLSGKCNGLREMLLGKRFDEVICKTTIMGLHVLPAYSYKTSDIYKIIAGQYTAKLINIMSEKYDHIIIDSPPVLAVPDALLWSKIADSVILTGFAGYTEEPNLRETIARLSQINAKLLGIVLNNVGLKHSYNYYGYGSYGGQSNARRKYKKSKKPLLLIPHHEEPVDATVL